MKIFVSLLLVVSAKAYGQDCIRKTLMSADFGKPIVGAHIYLSNQNQIGTITNEDGVFILCPPEQESWITISHLGYKPKKIKFSLRNDTINLQPRVLPLQEIQITDVSAVSMMESVIDSLHVNHYVEPILYKAFVRVLEYESDRSALHVFSEYLINVQINEKSKHKYKIVKLRAKPLSNAGKKFFKDMRVMKGISGASQHIFFGLSDYFKKKKLKKFDISTFEIPHSDFMEIRLASLKEDLTVTLVIEKETYAVTKISETYEEKDDLEVAFKKVGTKWILDYASRNYPIDYLFDRYLGKNREVETMRTSQTIFNINETEKATSEYKSFINIIAQPMKYHIGDWTDEFWGKNTFIPIPKWIGDKITESSLTRPRNPSTKTP